MKPPSRKTISGPPSIRASVLASLLDALGQRGCDVARVIGRHGLSLSSLADPYGMISLRSYIAIFEDAADELGDHHLGLKLGTFSKAEDLGPLGIALLSAPTLRAGLHDISRFVSTLQAATRLSVTQDGYSSRCEYVIEAADIWPRRQDAEFSLSALRNLFRLRLGATWRPIEVLFEHPLHTDLLLVRRIFGCPVRYGQATNAIVLDPADLDRSLAPWNLLDGAVDPSAITQILRKHLRELMPAAEPQTFSEAVSRAIERKLGLRAATLGAVAAELGLTPRTLQRRLQADGYSWGSALKAARIRAAERLLASTDMPIALIGQRLGFADGPTFSRAYKAWTAKSPRQARGSSAIA